MTHGGGGFGRPRFLRVRVRSSPSCLVDPRRHHPRPRGRYDTYNRYDKPKRAVWLRTLRRNWKAILNH